MGAIIMNGATIGRGAVIGAGALVKENMKVPELALVVGIPGKIVKTLTEIDPANSSDYQAITQSSEGGR